MGAASSGAMMTFNPTHLAVKASLSLALLVAPLAAQAHKYDADLAPASCPCPRAAEKSSEPAHSQARSAPHASRGSSSVPPWLSASRSLGRGR